MVTELDCKRLVKKGIRSEYTQVLFIRHGHKVSPTTCFVDSNVMSATETSEVNLPTLNNININDNIAITNNLITFSKVPFKKCCNCCKIT